jgi:hypothetical protein
MASAGDLTVKPSAFALAYDDVGAGVAQVEGVGAALAAVADDGDAGQGGGWIVRLAHRRFLGRAVRW